MWWADTGLSVSGPIQLLLSDPLDVRPFFFKFLRSSYGMDLVTMNRGAAATGGCEPSWAEIRVRSEPWIVTHVKSHPSPTVSTVIFPFRMFHFGRCCRTGLSVPVTIMCQPQVVIFVDRALPGRAALILVCAPRIDQPYLNSYVHLISSAVG